MNTPESLFNDDELGDADDHAKVDLRRIDAAGIANPVVVRALAGIVVATAVLIWPHRSNAILARLIAVALVVLLVTGLWSALRATPRRHGEAALALAGLTIAVVLLASPDRSEAALARIVGVAIIIDALIDFAGRLRRPDRKAQAWIAWRSVAYIGCGVLLIAFPAEVFELATTLVALGWIGLSLLVIAVTVEAKSRGRLDYGESTRLVAEWIEERPKSVDDRQELYDKILYEGANARHRVVRFLTLMTFASVIASMGVITDSTAVVIGAMLIAPLMTPLMGMAISLVMGWPRRLTNSALVAVAGIAIAVGISLLAGLTSPSFIDTATNSQVIGRASPTLLDLITALAAGSAGAYGLSRPDVSDSLPGVAIAISLVPPLSVVGIAYSQGDWSSGNGALLLFATNTLAILVMGGITFVLTGVTPVRRAAENQYRVRTSIAAVVAASTVVLGALLLNGTEAASNLFEQASTENAVSEWLDDHPDHSLVRLDLDGATVEATIIGPSRRSPSAVSLADHLSAELDRSVIVDLRLIVEERELASS